MTSEGEATRAAVQGLKRKFEEARERPKTPPPDTTCPLFCSLVLKPVSDCARQISLGRWRSVQGTGGFQSGYQTSIGSDSRSDVQLSDQPQEYACALSCVTPCRERVKINDKEVYEEHDLELGDTLEIGSTGLKFRFEQGPDYDRRTSPVEPHPPDLTRRTATAGPHPLPQALVFEDGES